MVRVEEVRLGDYKPASRILIISGKQAIFARLCSL